MRMHQSRINLHVIGMIMLVSLPAFGQDWKVVVNNGVSVPNDGRPFNSYNPPSVNVFQMVVFRGRSRGGGSGEPAHGVFVRDMLQQGGIATLFDRGTLVPPPNNLGSEFTEPPSVPRIDIWADTVASRGVHPPVWNYVIDPDEGTETRAGTTGLYTNPYGVLMTGMSNLGAVPGFEMFSVPGLPEPPVKFDVFPGAPAVVDGDIIVFKGNYVVDEVGYTGVFYRQLSDDVPEGEVQTVHRIASTDGSIIPGTSTLFGSTAPPSAALGPPPDYGMRLAVFAGFDNEENPGAGGIYIAELNGDDPLIVPLVEIGERVPGERAGAVFNKIGEGISFDGRFVAFWGAWGSQTKLLTLYCVDEGNKDRVAFCKECCDGYPVTVPVNQGIFVHDLRTGKTTAVAKSPKDFDDFVYWNFSGKVPGTGESDDDGELPRWRSAAFVAVSGLVDGNHDNATFHAAFKARKGYVDEDGVYADPVDGIYLRALPGNRDVETLVETAMDGTLIDPEAAYGGVGLPVTAMGIERDGFRGNAIAVNVSMGTEEAGWAGVYLKEIVAKK